ncbi:MAG: 6-bladed beta-propeller [Clostridiales bacterium]|nr:6-bladed beta-propeller [Clostridiales bacterium]
MNKSYFVLICLFVILGCNNKKKDKGLDINLTQNNSTINYTEIINKIDTVYLETNDSCLISNVNNIYNVDSLIFLLDKKQKTVFKYDVTGKFLTKLCNIGRGPNEYISISSFAIKRAEKLVVILDCTSKNIITYDFDFNEINRIKYDEKTIVRSLAPLKNGNLLWITPDALINNFKDGVWETNNNNKLIKHHVSFSEDYKLMWINEPVYSSFGNGLSFYNCYDNIMYMVDKDKFRQDFRINLKQKCSKDILRLEDFDKKTFTGNSFLYYGHVETKGYYLIKYFSSLKGELCLMIDKTSKKKRIIFNKVTKEDIEIFNSKLFCYNDNSIAEIHWDDVSLRPSIILYSLKLN